MQSFNIGIFGNRGVGKTSFISKIKTGDYNLYSEPTENTTSTQIIHYCNDDGYMFNVETIIYDHSGDCHKPSRKLDAAIIMFDYDQLDSYENISNWFQLVKDLEIPIIICGNKYDIQDKKIDPKSIKIHKELGLKMCDMSIQSGHNLSTPLLYLIRCLCNNKNIQFD